MEKLKREATEGGELTDQPCPICGLPRSRRSDYVRCQPCGLNWLEGEPLNQNPKNYRWQQFLSVLRQDTTRAAGAKPASGIEASNA